MTWTAFSPQSDGAQRAAGQIDQEPSLPQPASNLGTMTRQVTKIAGFPVVLRRGWVNRPCWLDRFPGFSAQTKCRLEENSGMAPRRFGIRRYCTHDPNAARFP